MKKCKQIRTELMDRPVPATLESAFPCLENVLEGRAIAVYAVPFQLQNDHALFCKKK
jgi:hypothetical protein